MTTLLGTPQSKNRRWAGYQHRVSAGVAWLGNIPSHWTCQPLRRFIKSMCDGPFGSDMKSSHYADSGVRLLRLQNVGSGFFDDADRAYVPEDHFASLPGHDAVPGDVIIAGLGDANHPVGRACLVPETLERAMVKADCFRVRLDQSQLRHSFLVHFLCSHIVRAGIAQQTRGATRERMNLSGVAQLHVPVPPLDEQQQIVAFLDRETAKLGALIARKQRLIELLQEKRTALISHTVTKGLNPQAPVEPSGIEWLGDIPEHWIRTQLKRVVSVCGRIGFRGYTTDDLVDEEEGALALGGANLTDVGRLDLSKRTFLSWPKYEESPEIKVSFNDLVIGQRGTCGKVVIIDRDIGPATINPSLVLLKRPRIDGRYLCYWLMGRLIQCVFDSYLNATAVPMLSQQQIGGVPVCHPPTPEQRVIASYLDVETAKLDTLIAKAERAIDLLHEYRTALISAAVTGKIDVRGEVD